MHPGDEGGAMSPHPLPRIRNERAGPPANRSVLAKTAEADVTPLVEALKHLEDS